MVSNWSVLDYVFMGLKRGIGRCDPLTSHSFSRYEFVAYKTFEIEEFIVVEKFSASSAAMWR